MKKVCQICNRDATKVEIFSAVVVRPAVLQLITESFPEWNPNGFICRDDLRKFRNAYFLKIMEDEKGELTKLETDVIKKLTDYETISINIENQFATQLTFGEKLSDKIVAFGGSWRFIIIFFLFLLS